MMQSKESSGVRRDLLIRCSAAFLVSLAVAALIGAAPASASYVGGSTQYMWGDILYERGGTEPPHDQYRGVAANVWTYGPNSYGGAWWVVGGSAHGRLSSIYIHRPSSFHHVEAGIERWWGNTPRIFWAYSADGLSQQYGSVAGPIPDAYTYLEVNNFTNSGSPPEEWRMAYGGLLMKKAILPFACGQMWMSTEVSNRYQDKRSQFRALQRRNPNGTWGWAQNMDERGGNLFNVSWGSYSPTHWYSWPTN